MVKEATEKHMIQKQFIEINFDDISDAFALQNYVSEVFYEKLLPQMEKLFDEFADDGHVISFEVLKIECPKLSRNHWEQEWVEETLGGLRKELLAANKIKIESASAEKKIREYFLFFLKHGRLPWNSRAVTIKDLEMLQLNLEIVDQIKEVIQADQKIADRLVFNFSGEFLNRLIQLLAEKAQSGAGEQLAFPGGTPSQESAILQSKIIELLCSNEPPEAVALEINELKKSPDKRRNQKIAKEVADRKHTKEIDEQEGIYVNNAGLIIFHPYLLQLFKSCDLIRDESWKDQPSQQSAVTILQWLVSGNDECPEFNLPLNKILCGLRPEETLQIQEPLSTEIKEECINLTEAVIQHWTALKNTGIHAFRETFLQRDGKLTPTDNGWLLQVEQKAVDVLLSRLPWGIGTIRLPWMDKILYTEWC